MSIDIKTFEFSLTPAIEQQVIREVSHAVLKAGAGARVTVRLRDINGQRGGVDKQCHVVAHLNNQSLLVAQATHSDLYLAIQVASKRLRRIMLKRTKAHLRRERKDAQRPGSFGDELRHSEIHPTRNWPHSKYNAKREYAHESF